MSKKPLLFLFVVAILFAIPMLFAGCGQLATNAKEIATEALDCTKGPSKDLVTQFAPIVAEVVTNATRQDGSMDWSRVEAATKSFEAKTGGCVLASVVAHALHPSPAKPGAPQSAPLNVDAKDLRDGFEKIRAKLGGKTYLTADGTL